MNIFGYETFTTFWEDFSIADRFGEQAIRDTYRRAFREWKSDYRYLTELVLILNHKCWQHYERHDAELSALYTELYYEANAYALKNLTGEEFDYFFRVTD